MKLPITEKLTLESSEDQWYLLVRGLINELLTTAVIQIESERKIRIKIVIKTIIPPGTINGQTKSLFHGTMEQRISNGMARIDEFFSNLMMKNQWLFVGYIDNKEDAPIFIVHYTLLNMSVYTQKLTSENIADFSIAGLN